MIDKLKNFNWEGWTKNLLIFSAPVLAIFFGELAAGVPFKQSGVIALIALYGLLADFFKKLSKV